jgi:hypothetical protein
MALETASTEEELALEEEDLETSPISDSVSVSVSVNFVMLSLQLHSNNKGIHFNLFIYSP